MRELLLPLLLSVLVGCGRCDTPDEEVPPPSAPTQPDSSVRVSSETAGDPSIAVVHHAAQLASLDLSRVERLDLALSATDLLGQLEDNDADAACQGLDLQKIARAAPRVVSLRISGCPEAVRAGLHGFGPTVQRLELADLPLDRQIIGRLAEMSAVRELTLVRVEDSEASLEPLARIALRKLVLSELERDSDLSRMLDLWPRSLADVSLQGSWAGHKTMITLNRAESLERLELAGTRISNFSFHQIKELPKLVEISLSGDTFNNATPLYFRGLPMRRLSCDCPRFSDGGIRSLKRNDKLARLELPRSSVTGAGLQGLADLPALEHLVLEGHTVDSAGLSVLAGLNQLTHLELSGQLEKPSMSGLGDLRSLAVLRLDFEDLDDRVGPELSKLEELEVLRLGGTALSDEGLAALSKLSKLRVLELDRTRVTNRGLAHLAELQNLEVLTLDHTDVVDDGIAHLSNLTGLRELRLSHTLLTDAGLQHLMGLVKLERLDVSHTVVTAQGALSLRSLPNLTTLGLEGTRATEQG